MARGAEELRQICVQKQVDAGKGRVAEDGGDDASEEATQALLFSDAHEIAEHALTVGAISSFKSGFDNCQGLHYDRGHAPAHEPRRKEQEGAARLLARGR
jgi:hypothetical protein